MSSALMNSAVMGSKVLAIAKDEWRYWRRSSLAQTVLLIALVLAIASVWVTQAAITATAEKRQHMQSEAKQVFEAQPDRHPHRMIHYGHYLFRAPPPLSRFTHKKSRSQNRLFSWGCRGERQRAKLCNQPKRASCSFTFSSVAAKSATRLRSCSSTAAASSGRSRASS